jgi:hypothetical protein
MKDIRDEMNIVIVNMIHDKMDEAEDIFNVDWDVYYATVFLVKEKIKFRLAEFASALPYNLDTM